MTEEQRIVVPGGPVEPALSKVSKPYVRARLAYFVLWIFVGSLALTFAAFFVYAIWPGKDWRDVKDLISLILTPEVAIVASILGYYFGNARDD
jgi:hypothetical protein